MPVLAGQPPVTPPAAQFLPPGVARSLPEVTDEQRFEAEHQVPISPVT